MNHIIDLTAAKPKKIWNLPDTFSGRAPDGRSVDFTNYYFMVDGQPFAGISAEMHFSRTEERLWEDDLIKLKMCGVNTIATYVFWNHHEEKEGHFNFSGQRNIRRFVELCQKHNLFVIVRLGPFCHGEVRNGGIPDWVYGKPFDVRSLNAGWLDLTRKLYTRYMQELEGLFFEEGGPIIGVQVENEYMHSSAPWELTTGIANEWVPGGTDGDAMMLELKKIALECGAKPAFFTCTGWGGASTPEGFMPLWGGYAFRPWLFYTHKGEHPATEEYLYQDYHNNQVESINYDAKYDTESLPYACCEMGGGMMCSYYYRFILPYKSVDAMANIKLGSGCNFLGYYMAVGGTNPKTADGGFLNEGQVPKMSYDYQAAIGEFGQLRESYRRLKGTHMFMKHFGKEFCPTKTYLPDNAPAIIPEDVQTLRWAVRSDSRRGFLFLNNYQDHRTNEPKVQENITICLPEERITFENVSLAAEENCILPFNMDLNGTQLKWATAQPFAFEKNWYVFMAPAGMDTVFSFAPGTCVAGLESDTAADGAVRAACPQDQMCSFQAGDVNILVLPREVADNVYCVERPGGMRLIRTTAAVLPGVNTLRLESETEEVNMAVFDWETGTWAEHRFLCQEKLVPVKLEKVGRTRYTVELPEEDLMDGVKDVRLQIDYVGDVGQAFIDGEMIADHFCNGDIWEIGLKSFAERLKGQKLTIYITPLKEGANVNVESAMAARLEQVSGILGQINDIRCKCVYEVTLNI